ncbi:hypothetical protein SAY87_009147 [Trapa incisa]|uniref:Uncharacterized protein n=1 Tax=Trapa incisa TaxID=236973 RepID=A0AAN7Q224_9MYRT|nr:hypothetical protein SAY87_009147 [Trapa incisa]
MINDLLPAHVPLRYPLRLTWTIKNSRTETNLGSIRSKALFALKDRGAEAVTTSQKEEGDEEEKEAKMMKKKKKKKKKKASSKGEASQSVVVVDPKSSKGPISYAIDFLEELMVKLMYDSDTACSLYFFSGNFAPVPVETPPTTDLPVKGHLPECLNGQFMRVGPNPRFAPVAGYHWYGRFHNSCKDL